MLNLDSINSTELLLKLKREMSINKFVDFVRFCFKEDGFLWNWHFEYISNELNKLYLGEYKKLMIFVPPQHGKLLEANTPVLTTNGFVKHGELKAGDYVFGQDGKPKRVIANSGIYDWNVNEVIFQSGYRLLAANEHLWKLNIEYDDKKGRREMIMETQDIFKKKNRRNPSIDISPALEFEAKELPINPYILGIWLGNGHNANGAITINKKDAEYYSQFGKITERERCCTLRIEGLTKLLKNNGLLNNKHIPLNYLLSSIEQRQSLLQGLMDTDGSVEPRGRCEFSQNEGNLSNDAYVLIRSLGYKASVFKYKSKLNGIEKNDAVKICFSPDRNDNVFRINRKLSILASKTKSDRNDKKKFFLQEIKPYGTVKGNCIEVEGGMYLAGYDLIPTHNSSISSILFPAWSLGVNPNIRIGVCSYSSDLASGFNRKTQMLMTNQFYNGIFPSSGLNNRNRVTVADGTALRNSEKFEIVGYKGFYKAVGVGGSLTGNPLDIGIIDDPFKDRQEADSTTIRNKVWNWYVDVFKTRLNNNSRQLMLFTRWHEDDLAGRILNPENNPYYSEKEANSWKVINLPALREDFSNERDPRQLNEALWENMHSKERLLDIKAMNPRTFASLYQQRPAPMEGGTLKRNWFNVISKEQFFKIAKDSPKTMYVDGAYTNKTKNDASAILISATVENNLYILFCDSFWLELPELVEKINELAGQYLDANSIIRIEPKASGLSVIQVLKKQSSLNIAQYEFPKDSGLNMQSDKIQKVNSIAPFAESGRVYLVNAGWNESFVNECCVFPNGKNDDKVDTLVFAAADVQFKREKRTVKYY